MRTTGAARGLFTTPNLHVSCGQKKTSPSAVGRRCDGEDCLKSRLNSCTKSVAHRKRNRSDAREQPCLLKYSRHASRHPQLRIIKGREGKLLGAWVKHVCLYARGACLALQTQFRIALTSPLSVSAWDAATVEVHRCITNGRKPWFFTRPRR